MKKYLFLILVSVICLFNPALIRAEYSLLQLRIANVLISEMGGVAGVTGEKQNEPMTRVAEVMRNMYTYQHTSKNGNKRVTYSDILFGGEHFEFARLKFAGKNKQQLEAIGKREGGSDWPKALDLAQKVINGTLNTDFAKGANAFNANCEVKYGRAFTNGLKVGDTPKCLYKKVFGGKMQQYTVLAVQTLPMDAKGRQTAVFWNWELGAFDHFYNDDVVPTQSPEYNPPESLDPTSGQDGEMSEEAEACTWNEIAPIYLKPGDDGETSSDKYCWYCKIVVVLVNAYLKVAKAAVEKASIPLGRVILKWGFLIWLAYYVLQQVSSLNPVAPGEMLQEIMVMMFKVALAYLAISNAIPVIQKYYLDPIVGTGVDYGTNILKELNSYRTGG